MIVTQGKLRRYMVFAWEKTRREPRGGWADYFGSSDDYDDAARYAVDLLSYYDYTQVIDGKLGRCLTWGYGVPVLPPGSCPHPETETQHAHTSDR